MNGHLRPYDTPRSAPAHLVPAPSEVIDCMCEYTIDNGFNKAFTVVSWGLLWAYIWMAINFCHWRCEPQLTWEIEFARRVMGKSWRWWGGKEEAVLGKRRKGRDGRVPETETEVIGGSAAYASGACAERMELPSSSIRDPLLLSLNPYVCHCIWCTCRPAHLPTAPYLLWIMPPTSYLAELLDSCAFRDTQPFRRSHSAAVRSRIGCEVGNEGRFIRSVCRLNAVLRPVLCEQKGVMLGFGEGIWKRVRELSLDGNGTMGMRCICYLCFWKFSICFREFFFLFFLFSWV